MNIRVKKNTRLELFDAFFVGHFVGMLIYFTPVVRLQILTKR